MAEDDLNNGRRFDPYSNWSAVIANQPTEPIQFGYDPATERESSTRIRVVSNARHVDMPRGRDSCHKESSFDVADYRMVEIHSGEEALRLTKHCGWCTGQTNNNHYAETYQFGRLFIFYKPSKRRPSYQLFVGDRGSVEFRKKGNINVNAWDFAKANASIETDMLALLPNQDDMIGYAEISEALRLFRNRQTSTIIQQFRNRMLADMQELNRAVDQFSGSLVNTGQALSGWMQSIQASNGINHISRADLFDAFNCRSYPEIEKDVWKEDKPFARLNQREADIKKNLKSLNQ